MSQPDLSAPHDRSATPRLRDGALLLVLFAASGCTALVYQVVWFQQLGLAIGSSALSLGVLLATFLGGLCIGSLLGARVSAGARHPLALYAILELGIGVLGVATLYTIPLFGGWYVGAAGSGPFGLALRLVTAAAALLPATILMGATLPLVAPWLRARAEGTVWLGLCYAANTAGGVAGSVLAGFYLLRAHDVYVATAAAVALNIVVALLAALAAARERRLTVARAHPPVPSSRPVAALYVATALSGMTALSAEVLWTRHLSLLLGGTVYTFALILAVFLLGIGLGSAAGAVLGRQVNPRAALAACQWLLCAALSLAAYTLAKSLPYWPIDVTLPTAAAVALELDLVRAGLVALPAALLWGASFPLALAAATGAGEEPQRAVGRLYAANTLGAITGALATTFVLVPSIGSQATQQLAIAVSACAALLLSLPARDRARLAPRRVAAGAALAVTALGAALAVPRLPPELVAFGRFLPTRGLDANVVYVGEGLTASIAVSREPDGTLTYHNAGKTQASTYPQDLRLQRMLGHLSTLIPESPSTVLVIGLGAGITAGAISVDPAVRRVVVAEIEPLSPRVASDFFAAHNFDVVANPKVEIRLDDGRHVLATTDERFDAITSDPLDPWVKGAATLYTREFWQLARARLNDGGVVTLFVQLYESTEDAVRSEIATFLDVFPNGMVFANTVEGMGYDLVLLGRAGAEPIDLARIERRLDGKDYERVARSLAEVGFDSALDLAGAYAARASDMAQWLDGAPLNTDRDLRLQYLAGEGLNRYEGGAIFRALVGDGPAFPADAFTGTPAQLEELRQRLAARRGQY